MLISQIRATRTLVVVLGFALGCTSEPPAAFELPPVPKAPVQYAVDGWKLRIRNNGPLPIRNLVVMFPESNTSFGDVPVGSITEYRPVPGGIFRYAAFRYQQGEQFLTQPVIDWVGEVPLIYGFYTYEISVQQGDGIVLIVGISKVIHD